jgi:hypothetical protein
MSIESTLERIGAIRQATADPSTLLASRTGLTGGAEAPASAATAGGGSSFAAALSQASSTVSPEEAAAGATAPSTTFTG